MPVPSTVDQFLELVSKSGLLDPQQFQIYLQRHAEYTPHETHQALANAIDLTLFRNSEDRGDLTVGRR